MKGAAMAYCEKCGWELLPDSKFCENCGTPVPVQKPVCPVCGKEMTPGKNYCRFCGTFVGNEDGVIVMDIPDVISVEITDGPPQGMK